MLAIENHYSGFLVDDLQLPQATTVFMGDSYDSAIDIMRNNEFSFLPVTNEKRRVVGMISSDAKLKGGKETGQVR